MNTFDYFKQICRIPRASGNEEGVRQYLLSWAAENHFEARRDGAGNIIIYCPATKGMENVPPVALQGHMDMVCVKRPGSKHDFEKDPIEVYQDGDFLKAKDTTLGGDNGIAIAMTMAIFTDKEAVHGPLEAIFTTSEETGMDGAFGLDPANISSRKLINLDSEEEGIIYIGCAGGIDVDGIKKAATEDVPADWETVEIKVGGMLGGHSGGEIHHQRANAISVLARMLSSISNTEVPQDCRQKAQFMLVSLDGGVRRNVIPGSATCTFCIPKAIKQLIMKQVLATFNDIKNEYKFQDKDMFEEHHCSACENPVPKAATAINPEDSRAIAESLFVLPHGVYTHSKAIQGVVETSDNLAIVHVADGNVKVELSCRSLVDSSKVMLANKVATILKAFGYEVKVWGSYPSWAPDPSSQLAAFCAKAWKETTGEDPVITSIHAGLECGIINSKIPGMDSVSIGPDLPDVHSVNEKLSISSTERIYNFVKYLLSIIR